MRDRQDEILLSLSFDYPTVGFATSAKEISMNKDLIPVDIDVTLDYKVNGIPTANPWDFTCQFIVPSNAEELVAEYNKAYKASYQLLSGSNYDLGEGISLRVERLRLVERLQLNVMEWR